MNSGALERGTAVIKNLVAPTAPAAAAQGAQVQASAEQQAAARQFLAKAGLDLGGGQEVTIHAHVNLDGEKVAHGIAKAKRSRDSGSFHAVPAGEGVF